jgi:hypothetical protein
MRRSWSDDRLQRIGGGLIGLLFASGAGPIATQL